MNNNEHLIHRFYTAFQNKDYATMQSLYHAEATFSDPVFSSLKSDEVKAMWEMLVKAGKDLKLTYRDVNADDRNGSCHWEAWYTFSKTGKKVHNVIDSSFTFSNGKILSHRDHFSFWRWSSQALGVAGILLGWTPALQNKVSETAKQGLHKFMHSVVH